MSATVFLIVASAARAQEMPALRAHHITLSAGMIWSGSYDVGDITAQLRGNGAGQTAPAFTFFTADSRVVTSIAKAFRIGLAITPRLAIDGGVSFAQPRIGVSISGDAEAPAQQLEGEKLEQYQIDAGLTWQLPVDMGGKIAPYVAIGGGYLRQLHEDRALAETGQIYYAGAGARYWLKGGHGSSKALGLQSDVRISVRKDGIDFENKVRSYPCVSVMVFVGL